MWLGCYCSYSTKSLRNNSLSMSWHLGTALITTCFFTLLSVWKNFDREKTGLICYNLWFFASLLTATPIVTQPMLQLRPNQTELKSMDSYHQIWNRRTTKKVRLKVLTLLLETSITFFVVLGFQIWWHLDTFSLSFLFQKSHLGFKNVK